jgi:hypothetical protein
VNRIPPEALRRIAERRTARKIAKLSLPKRLRTEARKVTRNIDAAARLRIATEAPKDFAPMLRKRQAPKPTEG